MTELFNTALTPWEWTQLISFYGIAALMIVAALMVVTLRNIFHSALGLAAVALGAAAIYLMLDAEFLAFVQILVYVGAVVTLIAFMVMLTQRASHGKLVRQSNDQKTISFIVVLSLFALLIWKIPTTVWNTTVSTGNLADAKTLGTAFLKEYIMPFEVISIVLLVALIGAIVLARREPK
jgi:NADH:ubiquinone oxidoreductase subunit 6 (subunit J)